MGEVFARVDVTSEHQPDLVNMPFDVRELVIASKAGANEHDLVGYNTATDLLVALPFECLGHRSVALLTAGWQIVGLADWSRQ